MRYFVFLTGLTISSPCLASFILECTADDKTLAFDIQMSVSHTPERELTNFHQGQLTFKRTDLAAQIRTISIEASDIKIRQLTHGRVDLKVFHNLNRADNIAFLIQTRDINGEETDYVGTYELRLVFNGAADESGRWSTAVKGKATCTLGP